MKNIVVLISGQGSNLAALLAACEREHWEASIVAVFSDRAEAEGLNHARSAAVAAEFVDPRDYPSRGAFDLDLADKIEAYAPALVVLAGYMRILSHEFVHRFAGRLVNIHPSVLPAFAGLYPHRRALEAGVRVHGATVHFVSAEVDGGPIIAQGVVPVYTDDDESRLSARVKALEHRLYPQVVKAIIDDRIRLEHGQVVLGVPAPVLAWGLGN